MIMFTIVKRIHLRGTFLEVVFLFNKKTTDVLITNKSLLKIPPE